MAAVLPSWTPRQPGQLLCTSAVRPADYVNEMQRGTVELMPGWTNYSFHAVVVPDGTVLDGTDRCFNFSQGVPNTVAIVGKNLTLKNCNLFNVAIDPSWTLLGCNASQGWYVPNQDGTMGIQAGAVAPPGAVTPQTLAAQSAQVTNGPT